MTTLKEFLISLIYAASQELHLWFSSCYNHYKVFDQLSIHKQSLRSHKNQQEKHESVCREPQEPCILVFHLHPKTVFIWVIELFQNQLILNTPYHQWQDFKVWYPYGRSSCHEYIPQL